MNISATEVDWVCKLFLQFFQSHSLEYQFLDCVKDKWNEVKPKIYVIYLVQEEMKFLYILREKSLMLCAFS